MSKQSDFVGSRWMRHVLVAAGFYNILWGALVVAFPSAIFALTAAPQPTYPRIWQCVGMMVGVFGIGYLIAAGNPLRHWPIVLVGLLGKILGPIGFVTSAAGGELPWSFGVTIITNDLIWWLPFGVILYRAARFHMDTSGPDVPRLADVIRSTRSQRGATLEELSSERPTLVVFVRHFGCTFCREALSDLAARREAIENEGVHVAVVHMSSPMPATRLFDRFGLDDVHRFSDPSCELYRSFGLGRGGPRELLGPKVLIRAFPALSRGLGLGLVQGDGFRMPGIFLLFDGRVVASLPAKSAADRPDYLDFVRRHAGAGVETPGVLQGKP